jgi:hypothetical protein
MDFIEGFPRVNGKSVILTVVDRFSKYAHFVPIGHLYTTTSVAKVFFDAIIKLHGILESTVSDRDPIFTSKFWMELFTLSGTNLQLSLVFHPQTDGQSEAVNKIIIIVYLWCLIGDRPRQWLHWLLWVNIVVTPDFRAPFAPLHSKLSTAGNHRLSAHSCQERCAHQRFKLNYKIERNSF